MTASSRTCFRYRLIVLSNSAGSCCSTAYRVTASLGFSRPSSPHCGNEASSAGRLKTYQRPWMSPRLESAASSPHDAHQRALSVRPLDGAVPNTHAYEENSGIPAGMLRHAAQGGRIITNRDRHSPVLQMRSLNRLQCPDVTYVRSKHAAPPPPDVAIRSAAARSLTQFGAPQCLSSGSQLAFRVSFPAEAPLASVAYSDQSCLAMPRASKPRWHLYATRFDLPAMRRFSSPRPLLRISAL